ncbi:hypothetical protein ACYUJ6_10385 [Clostridium sp. JNZ X4-2]
MLKSKNSRKGDSIKNSLEDSLIYENRNSYYEYLRDMKSESLNDTCDYSTVFMTF